jgi:hypothetical protein
MPAAGSKISDPTTSQVWATAQESHPKQGLYSSPSSPCCNCLRCSTAATAAAVGDSSSAAGSSAASAAATAVALLPAALLVALRACNSSCSSRTWHERGRGGGEAAVSVAVPARWKDASHWHVSATCSHVWRHMQVLED